MLTWCNSAVNFSFPSFFAASRTRSSPLRPLPRHGVRCELGSGVFSLVSGLPSTTSAGGFPLLFGCFAGTTPLYDSLPPCMEVLWLIAFSSRPAYCHGRRQGLPVLAHGVSLHAWGLRLRGTAPHSRYRDCAMLPSERVDTVGFPKRPDYGAQYPAYRYPCPTLQVRRYRRPHMARGQSGSLRLLYTTLSFATPCRFIPALSNPLGYSVVTIYFRSE